MIVLMKHLMIKPGVENVLPELKKFSDANDPSNDQMLSKLLKHVEYQKVLDSGCGVKYRDPMRMQ